MRELLFSIGVLWCADEGVLFIAKFKGGFLANNISKNMSRSAINLQRIHPKIWPKMVCLALKGFCYFW